MTKTMKKILLSFAIAFLLIFVSTKTASADCIALCVPLPALCSLEMCNTCSFCTTIPPSPGSSGIFGTIIPPSPLANFGSEPGVALGTLLNVFLKILIVGAGIYALFNLVFAGFAFMSAGDDPKKVAGAWAKISQTLLGLALTAGAFVLAAIFGQLIFGRWDFIINPSIPTL